MQSYKANILATQNRKKVGDIVPCKKKQNKTKTFLSMGWHQNEQKKEDIVLIIALLFLCHTKSKAGNKHVAAAAFIGIRNTLIAAVKRV